MGRTPATEQSKDKRRRRPRYVFQIDSDQPAAQVAKHRWIRDPDLRSRHGVALMIHELAGDRQRLAAQVHGCESLCPEFGV